MNVNVTEYVTKGLEHGKAIQAALDSGADVVTVPQGRYLISDTLLIDSNTVLDVHPRAALILADGVSKKGGDGFMIRNRDIVRGNHKITIKGGTWDANCANNPRGEEFAADSYGGVAISFMNVSDLCIRDLKVRDSESFAVRLGEVRDFLVDNITLDYATIRLNQDGVHVGGFSENGTIRNIRAVSPSTPNDDMVALNADDDVTRHFNRGMKRGTIRNVTVENLYAADAYTFVRLLSQHAEISNIRIRNIRGGCRYHLLNLHRWRFPAGGGNLRNITVEDVEVAKQSDNDVPLIPVSLTVRGLAMKNIVRTDNAKAHTLVVTGDVQFNGSLQQMPSTNRRG